MKPATVTSKPPVPEAQSYFGGTTSVDVDEPTPSADLIAAIKKRKRPILPIPTEVPDESNENPGAVRRPENLDHVNEEHVEMLREIREFLAFRAAVDGQASTDELLAEFGNKLPAKDSPLFKQMLNQLCTFRRVEGKGIWRLKLEFR